MAYRHRAARVSGMGRVMAGLGRVRAGLGDDTTTLNLPWLPQDTTASDYASLIASAAQGGVDTATTPAAGTPTSSSSAIPLLSNLASSWTKIASNILAPQTTYAITPQGAIATGPAGQVSPTFGTTASAAAAGILNNPLLLIGTGLILVLAFQSRK